MSSVSLKIIMRERKRHLTHHIVNLRKYWVDKRINYLILWSERGWRKFDRSTFDRGYFHRIPFHRRNLYHRNLYRRIFRHRNFHRRNFRHGHFTTDISQPDFLHVGIFTTGHFVALLGGIFTTGHFIAVLGGIFTAGHLTAEHLTVGHSNALFGCRKFYRSSVYSV